MAGKNPFRIPVRYYMLVGWFSYLEWYYGLQRRFFGGIMKYFEERRDVNKKNMLEYHHKMLEAELERSKAKIDELMK